MNSPQFHSQAKLRISKKVESENYIRFLGKFDQKKRCGGRNFRPIESKKHETTSN
jgi:hypothetical protein